MRKVFCELSSRELVLPDELERIVSLSPAVTETLYMLGMGDRVVGVSAFDVHPEEARKKPVLGSYSSINLDKLRSLDPQIVFATSGYQRALGFRLSDLYPTFLVELPVSVHSILDMVVKVGLVVNRAEEARMLAKTMVEALWKSLGGRENGPTVYVEIDLGGPVSFGAYSYITDAISLVGGRNVFGGRPSEWLEPDFGEVAKLDPDIIIYEPKMFRPKTREEVLGLLEKRGWGRLSAVAGGRVHVSPGPYDFLAHHGPSFVLRAMPWLRQVVGGVAGGP